jgi:hypothetical protein
VKEKEKKKKRKKKKKRHGLTNQQVHKPMLSEHISDSLF